MEAAREALANLPVGLHVVYLFVSKRSLVLLMLFRAPAGRPPTPP
ncbi:hypothetical protein ACFQS7_19195 [Dankookia sp. GCM10030260]